MSAAYMMELHFDEAIVCCEEAYALSQKTSILYYRWSQALSYNELANLEMLAISKDLIRKAAEAYAGEKIYKEQNKRILTMLNIHNTAESIEFQRNYVEGQIRLKNDEAYELLKGRIQ